MAPIRRYLRITKYSVLECRIYLDNPALTHSWLLNPRNPVLPRVIESVRPLVLPKLREEKERSRKRSTKKKSIKDVVVEDDFEVSIFLTETSTRHALLSKQKHFHDTAQTKLTSNSGRLVGATNEAPIDVDLEAAAEPISLRYEDGDEGDGTGLTLAEIPAALVEDGATGRRRSKRARASTFDNVEDDEEDEARGGNFELIDSDSATSEGAGDSESLAPPPSKRRKETDVSSGDVDLDDKKKLAMDISYDGFSIYGRVLCLVVKRRESHNVTGGVGSARVTPSGAAKAGGLGGQAMMEHFIISTQIPPGEDVP